MTEAQLHALMGYTSAVAMYLAGDGSFKRLELAARLLEQAFGKRLDGKKSTPTMSELPDIL